MDLSDNTLALRELTAAIKRQNATLEALLHMAVEKAPESVVTVQMLRDLFGSYRNMARDDDELTRMVGTMERLIVPFGAKRITDVAEGYRAEVLARGQFLLDAYQKGGLEAAERVRFGSADEPGKYWFIEDDEWNVSAIGGNR